MKTGADFLRATVAQEEIWVSDPTWENHENVFSRAGFAVRRYPYHHAATGGLRFAEMRRTFETLPTGAIVVLHASCHNPTGVDLSREQWQELTRLVADRGLLPFFDNAYQGFGERLDADAYPIRLMAEAGVECLVASSFSKNFSLYGERCWALSVVCRGESEAERVFGRLKCVIRGTYSTPPTFGAMLISHIPSTPELHQAWSAELEAMRMRLVDLRAQLTSALTEKTRGHIDFGYMEKQRGRDSARPEPFLALLHWLDRGSRAVPLCFSIFECL